MNYKNFRTLFSKRFNFPREQSLKSTVHSFTIAEKSVFFFLAHIFIVCGFILMWQVSNAYLVRVPTRGGTLSEGVIGNPRFINPVLAISEADKNLVSLIYSGLVSVTPDGDVRNDLAETIYASDDHTTYTVTLRSDARFHDDTPVTSDDIIFTIQKILDPSIKSPRRGNWEGVSVEKVDERTVTFTLKQSYAPFVYNLSLGILPRHIWKNVSVDEFSFSQYNTLPIGSGPYQVDTVERNSGGIPNYYKLVPFDDVQGGSPYIRNLVFKFYPSEELLLEAYSSGAIESIAGISPESLSNTSAKSEIVSAPLPRVFAVFFNQNQSKVLANKEVRQALNLVAPRQEIVDKVLGGYGTPIDSPIPGGTYLWTEAVSSQTADEKRVEALEILSKAGWQTNSEIGVLEKKSGSSNIRLSFSISTGDAPELQQVAEELAQSWRSLGAEVNVLVFETGDLNQNVIRPRNFDALLFGEVVGRDLDLYPFWHSSQRSDPGLNIALYANGKADKLLEEARSTNAREVVEQKYKEFAEEVKTDIPAIFLYTPSFLYLVPEKLEAVRLGALTIPQDRFLGVRNWYIEEDRVWQIFVD